MLDSIQNLKRMDFFNRFSDRFLSDFLIHSEIIHIKNKETLFCEDTPIDKLYIILHGSFKITKQSQNSFPVALNFLGCGEFLGIALAGLTHPQYPATAIALEDSTLIKFSRTHFLDVMIKNEFVRLTINRQIGERFLELENDRCMENALCHQRVADLLVRLWERQGGQDRKIHIPLTRKDIAHRVGTKSETIIRILSNWEKQGIIQTSSKRIELLDTDKLKEIRTHKLMASRKKSTKSS
ncbi:MAG: Crp/Fnr family transcriptional regulator [Bacillota bacterium]